MVDNPDYVEVSDVYKRGDIEYIGMEVWQVKAGTIFDNMLVTDDVDYAKTVRDAAMEDLKAEGAAKNAYEESQKPPEDKDELDEEDDYEEEVEGELDLDDLDKDEL